MNARVRRELIEEMVQEYDMPLVKSLMTTISQETGKSCSEAADIIITAWQRSKSSDMSSEDCYEHVASAVTAAAIN